MFGKVKEVNWLTKITISKNREENIRSCFDVQVNFSYPQNIFEFDYLIENFQRNKKTEGNDENNDNVTGESNKFDRLIVMDEVSGLADNSDNFASFLSIARKFNFTGVYVFHTMYPSEQNWQMIISQAKIFNIFPGSIPVSSVSKILTANRKRYAYEYIPATELWYLKYQLYFEISNSNKKSCVTIDCRNFNSLGLSKFRTNAESGTEQICYYNTNQKDKPFNCF